MSLFKRLSAKRIFMVCGVVLGATLGNTVLAEDFIKAEFPVLITSFGQAPDGNTISVLAKRAGVETTYDTLAAPEKIKEFKTIIVSFGVSLKGFGAAGVNLDTEMDRAAEILKVAKENKIPVIGIHIGGSGRRDQMSNKLIEAYAGQVNGLAVYKEGNQDNVFTELAKKNNVPFIEIEKLTQVKDVLQQILK